ncbi:hypothetical protein L2E82_06442 [Cichorium intybus]|uniref:Uncharacterized protein n=1 Tax=Cichorium intybus TaxID=13427 RepID=A0ACB9HA32_CICIN|nr:hypothetical protein L2E82_06442 [Cichorium intybus]
MSEKPLRGRVPVNRRIRPPNPSSATHKLRRRVVVRRSSKKPSKFINRCNSEPTLLTGDLSNGVLESTEDHGGLISQRRACADVFSSSPDLVLPYSPPKIEGYNKEAKVVLNVTVEGCPGPIRAMVKLGSSVEETMKMVKKQYKSEGRRPQIDQHSISSFELHPSHFSLQSLNKSDMIGNIGSRSFYMRKCNKDKSFTGSEIITRRGTDSPPATPTVVFSNYISYNFKKIIRLSNKLWKILGCIDG